MRIIVFGASGRLGTRLIAEALQRGHELTAVARDASRLDQSDPRVAAVSADVTRPDSVARVAPGHEVGLSAVTQHDRPQMLAEAARGLLDGLARAGLHRLVVAGGAGSLRLESGQRLMDTPDFQPQWKAEAQAQADALEVYQQSEGPVEWSYVSPAALLEPGERTGRYRTGGEQLLTDEQGHSRISMEDFAIAMLDEAEAPRHSRQRFTVAH